MKFTYYYILLGFYKIIKLGKGGDLWSACSASIASSLFFTISLHFTVGEIIGRELMVKYHSILWGNILLISLIIVNFYSFVIEKKYLQINFQLSHKKYLIWVTYALFMSWVILAFCIAFSNSTK